MATVFDKILDKEIPNYTVYENDYALAFLDINPSVTGHTLVIPKERVASIADLSPEAAAGFIHAVQEVNKLLKNKLSCDGVNHLLADGVSAGQEVMHVHMHLLPRYKQDGKHFHPVGKQVSLSSQEFIDLQEQLRS
ncbi:MAG: HIT family protein [Candidatus Woesearchaeota archaeon]